MVSGRSGIRLGIVVGLLAALAGIAGALAWRWSGAAGWRWGAPPPAAQAALAVGTIDGEFAVDANGGATYTIDLQTPPGTLGVGPKLAIAYTSQGTDGVIGPGVVLRGLSAINRCEASVRLDGYNGGIGFNDQDRFCLDGQRLMKVAGGGAYGAAGSVYHTETETWTQVTAVGQCGTGPCSFTAQNKDGWTLVFGVGDAGVHLPNVPEIAAWQLATTTDLHGNRVTASYQFDPATLQNLPREIAYTANDAAGLKAARRVTFAFEPRALAVPRYVGGFRFLLDRRLKTITTSLDAADVLQYRLAYGTSAGTGRDLLASIQLCAGDSCFPATQMAWQQESNALQSPNSSSTGQLLTGWCAEPDASIGWVDFNADGRPDAHCDTPSGLHRVMLSTGVGLRSPNSNPDGLIRTGWCAGAGMTVGWADFNGDAHADLVCDGEDGTHRVLLSNGSQVASPNSNPDGLILSAWCAGANAHAQWGNFNGDGRADLLCSAKDGTQRALISTSTGVTSPNSDPTGLVRTGWCTAEKAFTFWGDFNGDHLSDVHCADVSGVQQVLLSTGTTVRSPNSDPAGTVATGWCAGETRRRGATDLNGDGLLDSYCSSPEGSHWVLLSSGTRLVSPNSSADGLLRSSWCAGATASSTWADFNGDGLSDLLCRDAAGTGRVLALISTGTALRSPNTSADGQLRADWCAGTGAQSSWADFNGDSLDDVTCSSGGTQYALVHAPGAPDLARSITDGVGHAVELTYLSITDAAVYDDGDPAAYPILDVRSPMQVVSRYVSTDGRGARYSFAQRYRGARTDLIAQRWLGFQQVTTTEEANGRNTVVTYRQDYPVTAFVTSTTIADKSGVPLTRATYEPNVVQTFPQVYQILTASETNATYTNGVADYTVQKRSEYDAYGNRTYQSDESSPYYAVYTCQTFANDTAAWRLGYPTGQKTTRTDQSCRDFIKAPSPAWNASTDLRWTSTVYDAVMNARDQRAWDDTRSAWMTVSRTFDAAGNALTRTDAAGHVTTYAYDPSLTFPSSETSPPNADNRSLVMAYTFHRAFGQLATRTDPNGNVQHTLIDGFGRTTEILGPSPTAASGEATVTIRAFSYAQDAIGRYVETLERPSWTEDNRDNWFRSRSYTDGMDRIFRESRRSTRSDADIITETRYDSAAREWQKSIPHYSDTSPDYAVTTYDLLNRPLTVTTPDGTVQKHEYLRGALEVRTTEAFGTPDARSTLISSDPRALALKTITANGGVTTVAYDPVSQPISAVGPTGSTTTNTFDSLGRAAKSTDSDRGTTTWQYDASGLLLATTNGAGKSVKMAYDALSRVSSRTVEATTGAPSIYTFTYDNSSLANAQGNVSIVTGPGFRKELAYSRYGLVQTERLTLDNQVYIDSTDYDPQGRSSLRTFADGSQLRTTRFIDGSPRTFELQNEGTGPFVTYGTYDPYTALEQPLRLTGGNGLRTDYTYYSIPQGLARPRTMTVAKTAQPAASLLALSYDWNRLNEIMQIGRARNADPLQTDVYTRNSMGWLTTAVGPSGNEKYDYDLAGNITLKDGVTYRYVPSTNKQQDASNGTVFTYDGAGRLSARNLAASRWEYDHDAAGRLNVVRLNGTAQDTPLYDNDDARLRRADAAGVISRYVAADIDTVESGGSVRLTKYIRGVDTLIAAVTTTRAPGQMRALLNRQEVLREAALYDRGTLPGLGAWSAATLRRTALRAGDWVAPVAAALVLLLAIAGAVASIRRARAERRAQGREAARLARVPMTLFARQHPVFRAIVPCLVGSLLLLDVAPMQAQLGPGDGYPTPGTLYFQGDQVQSIVLVTNQDGQETTRLQYDPYGTIDEAHSSGPNNFRPKFSMKEHDARSGLDYSQARYYDTATGRFIEPDPQAQFSSPYVYAGNSPLDQIDPSGELAFAAVLIIAAIVGAVAGAYFGGAAVNHTMNPFVWDWSSGRTLAGILAGAAIGAAGGALGAVAGTAGVAPGIVAEIVIGAGENAAFTALAGGSQKDILEAALLGGAAGGVAAGVGAGLSSAMSRSASTGSRMAQRAEREVLAEETSSIESALTTCSSFAEGTLVSVGETAPGERARESRPIAARAGDGASGGAPPDRRMRSSLAPIQDVPAGAPILGKTDESTPATTYPVTARYARETTQFVDVRARGITVRATPEHPFWIDGKGWTRAGSLATGDRLLAADETLVTIDAVTPVRTDRASTVFNLEVGDAHTYYVSPLQLLVHNPKCTRSTRARMLRQGHDTLDVVGGRRGRLPPMRYGAPIRRYGPAAPGLPGGRYVDFGPVATRRVRIRLTGTNYGDFALADRAAGLRRGYRAAYNYTWHHVEDVRVTPTGHYEGTMLLVPSAIHTAWPHWGGEAVYRAMTGGGYP